MKKMKKALSILLCLCMLAQNVPVAIAAYDDNLCEHHGEHTADCGYVEAVAGSDCTHGHDDTCGYVKAVDEVKCACEATDENGALVHTEECGYIAPIAGEDCTHTHDDTCGYKEAVEEKTCAYHCHICHVQELVDALPDEVNAENAEAVAAQLTAIDAAKADLSDEEMAQVDFAAYSAAISALHGMEGQTGAEIPMLTFQLSVNVDGNTIAIEAESSDTIEAVKEKIAAASGAAADLVLTCNGQTLEDGRTLADYEITEDSTIAVINYYHIVIEELSGGTVIASESTAVKDTPVFLTVTPDDGYELESLTVIGADNDPVTVTDDQFTMPAANVTVCAVFQKIVCTCGNECADDHVNGECACGCSAAKLVLGTVKGQYPGGWNTEVNLSSDKELTAVPGKTQWETGDEIFLTLTSQTYGTKTITLTYDGSTWTTDGYFLCAEDEEPTVTAIYAPCYTCVDGTLQLAAGMKLGQTEYLEADCQIENGAIDVSFENVSRTYSRARIMGPANLRLGVSISGEGFVPAGSTEVIDEEYTLTMDEDGNTYFYGRFTENTIITAGYESYTVPADNKVGTSYALCAFHDGGTEQTCRGYQCASCGGWYGDASEHVFFYATGECLNCGEFLAGMRDIRGTISTYYDYDDVADGIEFPAGVGTLQLLRDIRFEPGACLTLHNGTLDLNGFYLAAGGKALGAVVTGGNLTICNSSETKTGFITSNGSAVYVSGGYFNVKVEGNVIIGGFDDATETPINSFWYENISSGILDLTGWDRADTGIFRVVNATKDLGSSILLPKGYVLMHGDTPVSPEYTVYAGAIITVAECQNHTGGIPTCTELAVCKTCGANYGVLEADYHTSEEFAYTANEDGTTHTKVHKCCGGTAGESEPHTLDSTTGKCSVCEAEMAAASTTIDGTITYHETVDDAIYKVKSCTAEDNAVVKLERNASISSQQNITSGVFTFDLGGNTLEAIHYGLNITGSSTQVTVADSGQNGRIIGSHGMNVDGSDVVITGGAFTSDYYTGNGVSVQNGTLTITGGTFDADTGCHGVYASNSTVIIKDGTFVGNDGEGVSAYDGTVTIENGTFNGGKYGVSADGSSKVTINGGTITGNTADLNLNGTGVIKLALADGKAEGATFPDGITVHNTTLTDVLDSGAAYWRNGQPVVLAEGQTEITGGDVTIKAACDHIGSQHTTVTDNHDGAHIYDCTLCGTTVVEEHSFENDAHKCVCDVIETFTVTVNDGNEHIVVSLTNATATFGQDFVTELTSDEGNPHYEIRWYTVDGADYEDATYENGMLTIPAARITGDIEIRVKPYVIITFHGNGGTLQNVDGAEADGPLVKERNYGSTGSLLQEVSEYRDGYNFVGLNTRADGTGTDYFSGAEYTYTEDLVLYAQWEIQAYTLQLPDQSLDVTYGTALADALADITPEKTGYNHTGWTYYWLDEDDKEQPYTGTTMPAFELYARPVFEVMEYSITWDMSGCSYELSNYGELPTKLAYNVDSDAHNVNFAKITAPEGYEFKGFTDGDGNALAYRESDHYRLYLTVSGDMTVKAVIEPKFYTATWKSDDGSYEKEFKYGETITIPTSAFFRETFHRAGCTLTGWTGYTEGMTMPLGGVTFTATWQIDDFTLEDTAAVYNGEAHTPSATVSIFTEGKDYTVSYADNVNAGTASVTVTGIGSCTGTVTKTFVIAKAPAPVITYPTVLNEITYGQRMEDAKLSFYENDLGTFNWAAPESTPVAGTDDYALDFYPDGVALKNYEWKDTADAGWIESRSALCTMGTVVVNKAASQITTAPIAKTLTYTGQPQELVTAGSTNDGTFVYSLSKNGTYSKAIPTGTSARTYTVYYKVAGDENHFDSDVKSVTVTIGKAVLTDVRKPVVTAPEALAAPQTKLEKGANYSASLFWDPAVDVFGYDTAYTASISLTPSFNYVFDKEVAQQIRSAMEAEGWMVFGNEKSMSMQKTFAPTRKAILTVTAADQTVTYGETIDGTGYTFDCELPGMTAEAKLTASTDQVTDNGQILISGVVVTDAEGKDVTNTLTIRTNPGNLTVTKRPATIKAKDQTIFYGQTVSQTEITASGLISGHSVSATLTPSTTMLTENGTITASNAVIKANGADVTANYELSYEDGKLVITFDTSVIDVLDPETVHSGNQSDLQEILDTIDDLLEEESLTETQKKTLEDAKADAEALLDVIEAAQNALDTENTEKVENVTADNVKPEDKEALEAAKADLEKALKDNADNYTEAEKKAIRDDIQRIEDAIEVLENIEDVAAAIEDLPDTVEPDDEETVAEIEDIQKMFEALTEHEKSLVPEDLREKLEELTDAAYDYDIIKGDGSKWTKGSSSGLSFTANGPFSKFVGIEVDGREVDEKYYEAKSGSTIITLKKSFLKKLSTGKHTITVLYTDGETSGTFKIRSESDIPATGDHFNIQMWFGTLLISTLGLAVLLADHRKRRFHG